MEEWCFDQYPGPVLECDRNFACSRSSLSRFSPYLSSPSVLNSLIVSMERRTK